MRYVAGTIQLSSQMGTWLERQRCEDRAADLYAWKGDRMSCVCGQHGDELVPLPPILTDDDD